MSFNRSAAAFKGGRSAGRTATAGDDRPSGPPPIRGATSSDPPFRFCKFIGQKIWPLRCADRSVLAHL